MFVYQTPKTSFQRLLIHDQSGNFKIIVEIKYNKRQNDEIIIEKQKQIIINTTVNKARVISKIIDSQFLNNQNINEYVFSLGQMNENVNYKSQFKDMIGIFHALIEGDGNEIKVPENQRNLLDQILNILDNGTGNIELNIIECKYIDNNKFKGIISYIKGSTKDKIDGNNDHLRLKGSGTNVDFPLSNLLLYEDENIMKGYVNWSNGVFTEKAAFIEFDFVNKKINMTSYTIRTIYNAINTYHPKTWKMIGSNDYKDWEMIDMKQDNDELNGPSKCSHFECTNPGQYYRYIRYVQIDNWRSSYQESYKYYIGLSAIEFFGSIKSS